MSLESDFETDSKKRAPKRKSIIKVSIIVSAVIIVLCVVVLGLYFSKNADYNNAIEMFEDSKVQESAQMFEELGDFKESKEYLLECNYIMASDVFKSGEYEEAAVMLEALGDYEDASEMLIESRKHVKYNEAKKLMDEGDYAKAKELFLELGNFEDSIRMAAKCKVADEYKQAVSLMESEDYKAASEMFDGLHDYEDSHHLALVCSYKASYIEALQKAENEEFTEAWKLLRDIKFYAKENEIDLSLIADEEEFNALKDECYKYVHYENASTYFENEEYYYAYIYFINAGIYDSEAKAEECIQTFPNGEIYSNPDYSKNEATIIFRSESARTKNEILKVYSGDTLVSMVAIEPGQHVTINIPEGVYSIVGGAGTMWFGEKNYFGGDGEYYKLNFPEEQSFAGMKDKKLFLSIFNTIIDIYAPGKTGNTTSVGMTYRQFLDLDN